MAVCKKKRSTNFSIAEKIVLVNLVEEHISVIESKSTTSAYSAKKNLAWDDIAERFNAQSCEEYRSKVNLKIAWDNLKKASRKMLAEDKMDAVLTGNYPLRLEPTYLLQRIGTILGRFCSGNNEENDSLSNITQDYGASNEGSSGVTPVLEPDIFISEAMDSNCHKSHLGYDDLTDADDKEDGSRSDVDDIKDIEHFNTYTKDKFQSAVLSRLRIQENGKKKRRIDNDLESDFEPKSRGTVQKQLKLNEEETHQMSKVLNARIGVELMKLEVEKMKLAYERNKLDIQEESDIRSKLSESTEEKREHEKRLFEARSCVELMKFEVDKVKLDYEKKKCKIEEEIDKERLLQEQLKTKMLQLQFEKMTGQ